MAKCIALALALLCLASCTPAKFAGLFVGRAVDSFAGGSTPSVDVNAGKNVEDTTGISGGENTLLKIQIPPSRPDVTTADTVTTNNVGAPWWVLLVLVAALIATMALLIGWLLPVPGFVERRRAAAQRIAATTSGVLLAFAFIMLPQLVEAQSNCGLTDGVEVKLATKFQERRIVTGVANERVLYEVWVSREKDTWTILQRRSDGLSCIMASGKGWMTHDHTPVPQGEEH